MREVTDLRDTKQVGGFGRGNDFEFDIRVNEV
jgi:hypothetical protein